MLALSPFLACRSYHIPWESCSSCYWHQCKNTTSNKVQLLVLFCSLCLCHSFLSNVHVIHKKSATLIEFCLHWIPSHKGTCQKCFGTVAWCPQLTTTSKMLWGKLFSKNFVFEEWFVQDTNLHNEDYREKRCSCSHLKAGLHGMIFAYDCCMQFSLGHKLYHVNGN